MNTHSGAGRQSLGIDAGGTRTRWALADADGAIVAEGSVAGWSATQMATPAGRAAAQAVFSALAADVLAAGSPAAGAPAQVCAGLTGFGGQPDVAALIIEWLSGALSIAPHAVQLRSDIEIAYLDSFAPGEGYLVYAGTGSIAAWIAADGAFHRAGGRGVLLDDGGGGYWIAREALRHIWRREDGARGGHRRWRAPCSSTSAATTGRCRATSCTAASAAPSARWHWPSPPALTPIRRRG